MKVSEIQAIIPQLEAINFQLPNGSIVPSNFHVTEVGVITRHFIDCGGTERIEKKVNFQLWVAGDHDHRLSASKLSKIVQLAINQLGFGDLEIEVEYQGNTIEKFDLDFNGEQFVLLNKQTACLAQDACGIPDQKPTLQFATLGSTDAAPSCTPGGGCC